MPVKLNPVIIYTRRFERCLEFYRKAFNLKPVRIYRGKRHPRWAQFRLGNTMFALHAGYRGLPYRGDPIWMHFEVNKIQAILEKITRYGGIVKDPLRKVERFPEGWLVYTAGFADPDGNEFTVQEIIKR